MNNAATLHVKPDNSAVEGSVLLNLEAEQAVLGALLYHGAEAYALTQDVIRADHFADPTGPQFTYSEDAPSAHGEGFAVLTFRGGRLLPPELVEVLDGEAIFRGQVVRA